MCLKLLYYYNYVVCDFSTKDYNICLMKPVHHTDARKRTNTHHLFAIVRLVRDRKRLNISSQFFFTMNHSSFTSVKHFHKIPTASPSAGALNTGGYIISRFSTNKSLYLTNDTKYRHSYHGRRIRTRMRSIKWCHFQWPAFKVTPLSDAKYLTNCYRYGHTYYRRRIGNCNQAFAWHQFQWPWVASKPNFKVTVLFNVK